MCHSHLDHHLMIRETHARLDGMTRSDKAPTRFDIARFLAGFGKKISLSLKGLARV